MRTVDLRAEQLVALPMRLETPKSCGCGSYNGGGNTNHSNNTNHSYNTNQENNAKQVSIGNPAVAVNALNFGKSGDASANSGSTLAQGNFSHR